MTWEAVMPVRTISSSTPAGWSSSWPRSDRSESERASSAGWRTGGLAGIGADLADQGAELLEDVVDGLDQPGSVADQAMAAPARQAVGRAGDGEDLAVLLHRVPGGRERAAARGGLDDDHAQRRARR